MIRVFPSRNKWTPTDELSFVGFPPLFLPPEQPVKISVTFTWDIPFAKRLFDVWSHHYSDVQIGGPAFDDPGNNFEPGQFIKTGVTFTSRGCPNSCPWCFVPGREGNIKELPIKPGWIVQDNNLLACSDKHLEEVSEMLHGLNRNIIFSGGFDPVLFSKKHIRIFGELKIREVWFSFDHIEKLESVKKVAKLLDYVDRDTKRIFVMVGFDNESIDQAERRLKLAYELGFLPFAQYYRAMQGKLKIPVEWKNLIRTWSRPAAIKFVMKNQA